MSKLPKKPSRFSLNRLSNRFSNDQLLFVKSLVQSPSEIGQVAPSSRFLAECMVSKLDLAHARVVVEYGPGTGSVTRAILARLGSQTAFFAIESNATMVSILRRRFPGVEIVHDSAERVGHYLQQYKLDQADYIISSLPFSLLPSELRRAIIENSYQSLRTGGAFVAYQYIHASLLKRSSVMRAQMRYTFRHVDSTVILRNLPPAFVFQCLK
ncbi:MAG: methyltransferase domain-containing protein [Acidobacteriota bacterium]